LAGVVFAAAFVARGLTEVAFAATAGATSSASAVPFTVPFFAALARVLVALAALVFALDAAARFGAVPALLAAAVLLRDVLPAADFDAAAVRRPPVAPLPVARPRAPPDVAPSFRGRTASSPSQPMQ
jgi:hypothetical protein